MLPFNVEIKTCQLLILLLLFTIEYFHTDQVASLQVKNKSYPALPLYYDIVFLLRLNKLEILIKNKVLANITDMNVRLKAQFHSLVKLVFYCIIRISRVGNHHMTT